MATCDNPRPPFGGRVPRTLFGGRVARTPFGGRVARTATKEQVRAYRDHGTASLELVIVAPFLLALLMMIIAFGRYAQTENLVDQAARDAARASTAQNVKADVPKVSEQVLKEAMIDAPDSCRSTSKVSRISMTKTAFGLPDPNNPIAIDSVSVEVTCTLDLGDLAAIPLKDVTITRTFTSPLDRYRGYQ